jgi:hypothetical protein
LYDLTQDKGELVNLAQQQETVLKELIAAWSVYEAETGVIIAEDAWAVRYPPNIFGFLNVQNTTLPGELGNVGVITCVNSFLFACTLLFWLCPSF